MLKCVAEYRGGLFGVDSYLEGRLRSEVSFRYDNKGNKILVERIDYDFYGSLEEINSCKYDDIGNLIESNRYYCKGFYKENYKYDDRGNIIEERNCRYEYKYDAKGNWIEKITYQGEPMYITERKIEYYAD